MCDFAERSVGITALAVRQGEGHTGICGDHITIVIGRDAVTVQAERDTAVGLDHVIRRKVGGQVISSRRKRIVAVAAHSPFDVVNIQCAAYLLDLLGKGGLAAFSCMAAAVAGVAPAEVVGVPITQLNLSTRQLKPFAANIGNEVIGGAFAAHFGIPAGGKRLIAIISVQRHTELCTIVQFVGANGDCLAGGKIDIVLRVAGELAVCALCSAHGIIGDGHFAADFDGAAAHIHAAAVAACVVAGDGGRVFHSEIAAAHIHAAAPFDTVSADGGGVFHSEIAAAHIHATAKTIVIAAFTDIVGYLGVVGHGELAAVDIYAAAVDSVVAADAAAGHPEGAVDHIHAAAIGVRVGLIRIVAGDAAAGHPEGAVDHIHAAASGGVVAGDGGGVFHSEIAAVHFHAASSVGVVAGDAAAGHIEGAAEHIHAAAIGGRVGLIRILAADAAAVHIE